MVAPEPTTITAYIREGLERFFSDYYCPNCGKKLDYLWLKREGKGGFFYILAMGLEHVLWCKKCKNLWQRTIWGHFMDYDFGNSIKVKLARRIK
jgi:hypothetical protein